MRTYFNAISYTLEDNISVSAYYKVDLYLVRGNGSKQLLYQTTGDVGDSIKVGSHRIMWRAEDEFTRYKGNLVFEVRAVRNFMILKPDTEVIMRRGKNYRFEWFGEGSTTDTLVLELFQFNNLVDTLDIIWGDYTYNWDIPKSIPPGEEYQLRIVGINSSEINAMSEKFMIRRNFPVYLQVGAGVLAAGLATAAYFIFTGGTERENDQLPLPPPALSADN